MGNSVRNFTKTLLILIILILVFLTTDYLFGIKGAFYIMAASFLIMALLFTFKREYLIKYMNFVNPSYTERLDKKGEDFKKKNITTNIVCFYIMSLLTFYNGHIQRMNNHLFTGNMFYSSLKFIAFVLILAIIMIVINNFIVKKSKSNTSYVVYSVILGVLLGIILMAGIVYIVFKNYF